MKHIKTYEDKKNEESKICFGFIKPEKLKTIISQFKEHELKYRIFEAFDQNDNFNIVAIVQATKSQQMSMLKYVTLTSAVKIAAHVATTCKDITDMTAEEILERYDMFTNTKNYNL